MDNQYQIASKGQLAITDKLSSQTKRGNLSLCLPCQATITYSKHPAFIGLFAEKLLILLYESLVILDT